jgi:hypothetical protein
MYEMELRVCSANPGLVQHPSFCDTDIDGASKTTKP